MCNIFIVIDNKHGTNAKKAKLHAQTEATVLAELPLGALPHHKMNLELEPKERKKDTDSIKELICEVLGRK